MYNLPPVLDFICKNIRSNSKLLVFEKLDYVLKELVSNLDK